MKRLWLGVALMAVLLVSGFWVGTFMNSTGTAIAGTLDSAAEAALSGDWQAADDWVKDAHTKWDELWHKVASVADHAPMDEIDSLFAQLKIYTAAQDRWEFAAYCQRISQLVLAVGEAHSFNWWNLL